MKFNIKKVFTLAGTVTMAAFTLAACSTASTSSQTKGTSATGNTIKIGVNMELSGAAAGYGDQQKKGIQLAVAEINKAGGIKVDGKKKKIQLVIRDNKTSTSTAASVAAQLTTKDKVVATIGPATTSDGTAAIPNQTKAAVPMISPSATDPNFTLTKSGATQDFVFRTIYSNTYQASAAAKFITNDLHGKKVIVLADNSSDYGTGLAKAFKQAFTSSIVSTAYFQEGDKDFNSLLTSIKSKNFDAIYVPGYYTEVGAIIKQARQMGITAPIVGTDGMADAKLVSIAGKQNATNIFYTTSFSAANTSDKKVAQFIRDYKAKYKQTAPTFAALSYDSVYMIKAAIESQNSTNSVKIKNGLAKLTDFKGVTGTMTVNKKHNVDKSAFIEQLTNGTVSKTYTVK